MDLDVSDEQTAIDNVEVVSKPPQTIPSHQNKQMSINDIKKLLFEKLYPNEMKDFTSTDIELVMYDEPNKLSEKRVKETVAFPLTEIQTCTTDTNVSIVMEKTIKKKGKGKENKVQTSEDSTAALSKLIVNVENAQKNVKTMKASSRNLRNRQKVREINEETKTQTLQDENDVEELVAKINNEFQRVEKHQLKVV